MLVPKGPAGWMAMPLAGSSGWLARESGHYHSRKETRNAPSLSCSLEACGCTPPAEVARANLCGGGLPARRSRLAGSPWASSACQISCGRCWAAPRTSDREDVSGRFDAGEQHAAVGTERRSCELAVVEFVGRKRVGLALVRRTDKVLDALGVLGASDGYGRLFRIRSGCSGCPRVSYRVVFHRGVTSTADGVPTPSDPDANGLVRSTG